MGSTLSKSSLRRMHTVMAGYVERGEIAGAVTLVARSGDVHVDAAGSLALGGSAPMARDSIFRISSMTKPITAVAAMILVEECTLRLDEPVDELLPELANRRVLENIESELNRTVPATRAITLRDLLTSRLGFGIVMRPPGSTPIQRATDALALGQGPPNPKLSPPPDEWMRRFGTLPLMHQPGEQWMYNTGLDILGVLIARASGMSFPNFLRERVFEPLAMKDTAFFVPEGELHRFTTAYIPDQATGTLTLYDDPTRGQWISPPAFPAGGSGLVSTVDDLLAFGEMMLGHGARGSTRILARPTIELMTIDHLTTEQKPPWGSQGNYFATHGWGFGMSIVTRSSDYSGTVGAYGWDGGLGTSWYCDPREGMVRILMTQAMWTSPAGTRVAADFGVLAYQAIDD